MITKLDLIDSMVRLSTELLREKDFHEQFGDNPNWEYYLLAELYRTLDQYTVENDIQVSDIDRCF